ncbi:hypothetical protein ES703_32178 [subsurface metagenome]
MNLNFIRIPVLDFESEQVNAGDVYQFSFLIRESYVPILEEIQKRFAEYIIERGDKFEVENVYKENGELILQARCIQNPLPFLAVFGLIVAGSSTLLYMFGLQLNKVHKIVSLPQSKILSYVALIVSVVVGYKILR